MKNIFPEQQLKAVVLRKFHGKDRVKETLSKGLSIDELWISLFNELLGQLSPEQRLKAETLRRLLGEEVVEGHLIERLSIDALFTQTAELLYSKEAKGRDEQWVGI